MANNELLYECLIEATAFPEVHHQTWWAGASNCGTAYCIAGLAVALTEDYELIRVSPEQLSPSAPLLFLDPPTACTYTLGDPTSRYWDTGIARGRDGYLGICTVATDLLGLSQHPDEADKLFAATNSIDRLWELAERFTDGEVKRPPQHVIDEYRMHGSRIKKIDAQYFPA